MKNNYYVYIYLDPRKPGNFTYGEFIFNYEPFYIGKGKGKRAYLHIKQALKPNVESYYYNPHKSRKIKNIIEAGFDMRDYVLIASNNLSEEEALFLEEEYIKLIGRYNNKTGPLTNLSDSYRNMSDNLVSVKGKTYEEIYGTEKANELKQKRKMDCQLNTEELIEKNRNNRLGKTWEEVYGEERAKEIKNKLSESQRNKKYKPKGRKLPTKGKTYEEIYGEEEAKRLKKLRSETRKGKTNEELYGKEKAEWIKQKIIESCSGEKSPKAKVWKFISQNGEEFITKGSAAKFCEEKGLDKAMISRIANNKYPNKWHRGWTVQKLTEEEYEKYLEIKNGTD
jgi:hypothetical protein